jgi:hypothetical protein
LYYKDFIYLANAAAVVVVVPRVVDPIVTVRIEEELN